MAQTKRKRKHRGTQAGVVQRPAPSSSRSRAPASKADTRRQAAERRAARLDTPPTWKGSVRRAGLMALIFAALAAFLLGRGIVGGLILGAFMLVLYVPMSYYTDTLIYRRRQRSKARSAG